MSNTTMLSTRDVAERLGLQPITVKLWRLYGKGPKWQRIGTRTIRYALADVEAYLEQSSKAAKASPKLRKR
jgi:predicted DNA-binding transcriptional regulator AlpA